jgi:hypothetical protein
MAPMRKEESELTVHTCHLNRAVPLPSTQVRPADPGPPDVGLRAVGRRQERGECRDSGSSKHGNAAWEIRAVRTTQLPLYMLSSP